jgi:hypothetical protein
LIIEEKQKGKRPAGEMAGGAEDDDDDDIVLRRGPHRKRYDQTLISEGTGRV